MGAWGLGLRSLHEPTDDTDIGPSGSYMSATFG